MIVYGLKNCDSCRKAVKALDGADLRDVRQNPLAEKDISRFLARFGDDLVNRRSTTWRGMTEAERARPAAELLRSHPSLMKRPVIEKDGELYLGWGEETRQALL